MSANFNDNSVVNQRSWILRHLEEVGPITTLGARSLLDICHPGMRVCELRKNGFPIVTVWVHDLTPEGNFHRVGQYILQPRKQLTLDDFLETSRRKEKPRSVAAGAGAKGIIKSEDHNNPPFHDLQGSTMRMEAEK